MALLFFRMILILPLFFCDRVAEKANSFLVLAIEINMEESALHTGRNVNQLNYF